MHKIQLNNAKYYEIRTGKDHVFVNGEEIQFDVVNTGSDRYHVLYKGRSYRVNMAASSGDNYHLLINGRKYMALVKDEHALLLEKLGLNYDTGQMARDVKAPMPGMVVEILVKEGDEIRKGDPLLVLEAMKMENMIKAPADGVVKNIPVKVKQAVDKNQLLIGF